MVIEHLLSHQGNIDFGYAADNFLQPAMLSDPLFRRIPLGLRYVFLVLPASCYNDHIMAGAMFISPVACAVCPGAGRIPFQP
jgi:hypothetical protein